QRLVVGGVLAEYSKLLEGIVHRMRPCVQGSKVLPRMFFDPLGVSGQLVPEAIEVDELPATHQTLLVRTPEIEVPQHWAANDVVPIAYSGQRCIDHHPARDPERILSSQCIADILPMSCVTRAAFWTLSASMTPAMSTAWFFLV